MSSIVIRKAHFSDIPYLYDICLRTGKSGESAEESFFSPYLLGDFYAVNYMLFEQDSCFVVEDLANNSITPLGYILGCCDSTSFATWMETKWLPVIRKRYPSTYIGKTQTENNLIKTVHTEYTFAQTSWNNEYPAHLHIDILPSLQGKGCGRLLLEIFSNHLIEQGVVGVHLGVSKENTSAIAFYVKMGFIILEEHEWGLIMGKKLS